MTDLGESAELADFRERWKAEVRDRSQLPSASDSVPKSPSRKESFSSRTHVEHPPTPVRSASQQLSGRHFSAVHIYRLAAQQEQDGDLDNALALYRHAFKLDPNADRAYRKAELEMAPASKAQPKSRNEPFIPRADTSRGLKALSLSSSEPIVTNPLSRLVSFFGTGLEFEPQDESMDVPLRILPDELLVLILTGLEPVYVERFALVSKKARSVTLDSAIWKELVKRAYVPPQIPEESTYESIAAQYMYDYRRFYVEHPRLRLDGVYIAVCHYVRPGLSENAWVQVSHLVTYHRYLRFMPDGIVISLLANEEEEPKTIIPLLKPTFRMKGLLIGTWLLDGTTIVLRSLMDPNGDNSRYAFQMSLDLRSRPLGRWNKLELSRYDSVKLDNGEISPVFLKHERPFWFSKVRSYV